MKFNKWTLGLAAVGAVSLVSAAKAEEKAASPMVMTGVASTTLSGYVDTSIHWNPGTGNANVPAYGFNNSGKADGFNLDAVLVRISKGLDETEWAAGYDFDIFAGPDAVALNTSSGYRNLNDFGIKQAYVTLRTPIGHGIDWKIGVFDNWIGYESTEAPSNPNYTRSYGYTMEPTTFTGLTGTYKVCDEFNFSLGIADTVGPAIGGGVNPLGGVSSPGRANPPKAESSKTILGSVAFTAPSNWGFLSGSSLYAGFVDGFAQGNIAVATGGQQLNYFLGATLNTPVTGLKAGFAYDHFHKQAQGYTAPGPAVIPRAWADAFGLYASFAVPDTKWSFHTRGEFVTQSSTGPITGPSKIFALTGTVQYDLWANVLSRLELRWDHQAGSMPGNPANPNAYGGSGLGAGGGAPTKHNYYTVAANIIYKF